MGPLELTSSCPPPPDTLLMLPPERKPQSLARTGGIATRFWCQRHRGVNLVSEKSGEDPWLQAQLSFLSPITEISQKGSLLTTRADGQETAERKGILETLAPHRGAAVTQKPSTWPRQTPSQGNGLSL